MPLSSKDLATLRACTIPTSERIVSRPVLNVRHVISQVYDKTKGHFVPSECWVVYDYSFERTPICSTSDPAVLAELIKIESTGPKVGALRKLITGYAKFHEEAAEAKAKATNFLTQLEIKI